MKRFTPWPGHVREGWPSVPERLGKNLVKVETPESEFAEDLYRLFDTVDLWLGPDRKLAAEGLVGEEPIILA